VKGITLMEYATNIYKRVEQWKSDRNVYVHAADENLEEELSVNQYFNQFHVTYLHLFKYLFAN